MPLPRRPVVTVTICGERREGDGNWAGFFSLPPGRSRSLSCFSGLRLHDVFPSDPGRACARHPHRAVLRRAGGGVEVGGRRLRQAAPDDGAALHHRLDRRQPRVAPAVGAADAGPARGGRDWRSVAPGARVRVPDPADVSLGPERIVLQLEPGRAAARVQLHRPVHSREPVQLPGEQRRAGGGPLLPHPRRRRGRCRPPGAPARRPAGGQRRDLGGHPLRHSPDSVWTVCDCGQRGGNAEPGAVGPSAGLPRGLRRRSRCWSACGCSRDWSPCSPPFEAGMFWASRTTRSLPPSSPATFSSCCRPHAGQPHAPWPPQSRRRRSLAG